MLGRPCVDGVLHVVVFLVAAMGATFALTESVVANQRQVDDPLNGAAGGCAAGFLAGIRGAFALPFLSQVSAGLLCPRSTFIARSTCLLRRPRNRCRNLRLQWPGPCSWEDRVDRGEEKTLLQASSTIALPSDCRGCGIDLCLPM